MTLSLQPWLGLSRKICKVALEIFSPEFWEKVPGLQEMCFILKWPHRREKRSGAATSLRWRRQPSAQWRRDLEQWLEMMERVDQQTFSLYKYRSLPSPWHSHEECWLNRILPLYRDGGPGECWCCGLKTNKEPQDLIFSLGLQSGLQCRYEMRCVY